MVELTKSQKEVLDKIKLFIEKNGYAPTVRELCFLTDRSSPATIHFHLKHLKEKGYIDFDYNKNRTIRLIDDNKDKVISDLLKRVSNLEFELEKEIDIKNKAIEYIEKEDRYRGTTDINIMIMNKFECDLLEILKGDKK